MISSISQVRTGTVTTVTATSTLSAPVFFFWYLDGAYIARTLTPTKSFKIPSGDQGRVDVLDSTDPDFDPIANAPAGFPARRSLWWVRSLAADVAYYQVEVQKNGGAWTPFAQVRPRASAWSYSVLSDRLDDLTTYAFRVVPYDSSGNAGTPIVLASELVVRTPDSPDFSIAYTPGTGRVTVAAA